MMEKRAIQLLFCLGIVRGATRIYCPYNQILCGNGADCIQVKNICDYSPDCSDSSDEYNLKLCKVLVKQRQHCSKHQVACSSINYECLDIASACARSKCLDEEERRSCKVLKKYTSRCSTNQIKCTVNYPYNCFDIQSACTRTNCLIGEDKLICKVLEKHTNRCSTNQISCPIINCMDIQSACEMNDCLTGEDKLICEEVDKGKLTPVTQIEAISNEFKQKIDFMYSMMKSSWEKNFTVCPLFYKEHKGLCYSMFAPLEVKWAEAKLFCESIAGQIAIIRNVTDFANVLDFLSDNGLQNSLWIGGSSFMNKSEWRWVNGEQVQMGVPFWSLDYTLERTNEKVVCKDGTENIDVQIEIRPRKNDRDSMCIAMMKENFYYFSDEFCSQSFAPLCTRKPF